MKRKILKLATAFVLFTTYVKAHSCEDQLFSVTIKKEISIADAIDNIAETCGLSVIVKDVAAQKKLQDKLFYIKLRNATLESFLDTILKENNINYKLVGNKLLISYLITKTFKVHYIASKREGGSSANINIANAGKGKNSTASSSSGMTIVSNDKFDFWSKIKDELHKVLVASGDGSLHFSKQGDGTWIEESTGKKWQYNPLEPIIDAEAGLITVTGTPRQIERVAKYLSSLANQVKTQVLIDVKILSVSLSSDKATGIDWSKLYGLQDFTISTLAMSQSNMAEWKSENGKITEAKYAPGTRPSNASLFEMRGAKTIDDIIRYLKTQGNVKTISNPKVMTLNNQPALISVGKELFFKTKTSTTTQNDNGETTTSETIDSVFAGILLDITPEIDKRGMITLKINPSITETDGPIGESGTRSMPPDLIRRQISTVIKVKDGKHAVLGGLISSAESVVDSKVPLLGDIPLVGEAFKRKRKIKRTEELVVIITPKIISGRRNVSLKSLGYRSIVK
ncbi:MAG: pilus (MSHA type) biogenesis protein MshL [Epsilonproteobacteria bacterium]|nr:pilus (MSHA type) biogenesis protein MshL [Campylobacterota bacterium]